MKKIFAVLLVLVAIMSLSTSAFAKTTDLGFDPAQLYAPAPAPAPAPANFAYITLAAQLVNTQLEVDRILNSNLIELIPTNEYTADCYIEVDPDAKETAEQFVVRRVVVKETEKTPYCKQYYFNKDGSLLYVQYDNDSQVEADRFYFANRTEGENKVTDLLFCKVILSDLDESTSLLLSLSSGKNIKFYTEDDVTLLTEGDEHFDEIEKKVLAEGAEVLAAAQAQLQLLQQYGLYKNIIK